MFDRLGAERAASHELRSGAFRLVVNGDRFAVEGTRLHLLPLSEDIPSVFLGRRDGVALFLCEHEDAMPEGPTLAMLDFRAAAAVLEPEDAALLSYAQGMLQWTRRTRFCGACGTALEARFGGHVRGCPGCGSEIYPRTDPAVMMLVTHRDRLLLAVHRGRPVRTFSTLAGFVEPGESLEATVRRELAEETGLTAATIRYFGSQPWPLPASLMIGFFVETEEENVTIDESELVEARWFSRQELDSVPLSSPISLSRWMIEAWRSGC